VTDNNPPRKTDAASLSQDLSGFLIELSIALNKHATYPHGHPSLGPASTSVARRGADLLVEKNHLSLGVAQDQLIIEGVATDPKNAVLNALAGRLHRHHLGAMTFSRGVTSEEVHDVLGKIAMEADRQGPLGLGPEDELAAWEHIRLFSMNFEQLELADGGLEAERSDDAGKAGLSAQLWLGLARAAMSKGESEDGTSEDLTMDEVDPGFVAAAIDSRADSGEAYDQVIVGYMMKIAEELKSAQGNEALALKKRMSSLISTLTPGSLDRLMEMGGNRQQRKEFMLNAAEGMTADAVLDLVKTAGHKEKQNVSNSMLRMLQKLSQHADLDRGNRQEGADKNLRDQMSQLINGWSLTDPNPDGYTAALVDMSATAPTFQVAPEELFRPEPRRIVEMALEIDVIGKPVAIAVRDMLEGEEIGILLNLLDEAGDSILGADTWSSLSSGELLRAIILHDPPDLASLDRIIERFGDITAGTMLDVLVEAESKATRRALIDRLVGLGTIIGAQVVARLRDDRWYVQRNMLNILARWDTVPEEFLGGEFMSHSDPRVRREAMSIMFKDRVHRERAICKALADKDNRTIHAALAAAAESCPPAAVSLVVSRSTDDSNEELQVAAIRVLDKIGGKSGIQALLRLVEPQKKLFGMKLPPKSQAYLVALRSVQAFSDDPRVKKSLAAAAKSKDPEIVRAATSRHTTEQNVQTG
jgi:hypothetical protein